jgi:hypothetical protein
MSGNQLPAILNVSTIQSVENMNIKTEVLDPITITDQQAIFQIPKNGILDGGSTVQLGVLADPKNFFPLNTGIHGLIKSVFLKVGGQTIASNDDYAYYTTMTRQFETPEHRAYVDMVKSGACGDRWGVGESGRLGYRDLLTTVNATATLTSSVVPEFIRPTLNPTTTPLFTVPLSTLIPMMRSRQLPLMAIKEHVYLEINFNTQAASAPGVITCITQGQEAHSAVVVSTTNIKFMSDHLYYTDEKMNGMLNQTLSEQGMSVLYEDLITTRADVPPATVPTGGVATQVVERQLAVSGKVVRNIMIHEKNNGQNHNLLGNYLSTDLIIPTEFNLRINDQRIYDRNLVSQPRKYNELTNVLNKPLMVPNQLYSFDADSDKQDVPRQKPNQNSVGVGLVEGHQLPNAANADVSNDLRATSHFEGYDATTTGFNVLGNGAKIGVKPIIISKVYSRQADDGTVVLGQNATREMRIFTGIERIFVIKNGSITVSA